MPVISTLNGASISNAWKKTKAPADGKYVYDDKKCQCCCNCHQRQGRIALHPVKEPHEKESSCSFSPSSVQIKETGMMPPRDDVQRAPFRAFNGKAYSVPFGMVKELEEFMQLEQSGAKLHEGRKSRFSYNSPGILWRHDPYSTNVIGTTAAAFNIPGKQNDGGEGQHVVVTSDMTGNAFSLPAYNHTTWNPMCVLQPTATPLGTVLCFPAVGGVYSPGMYSSFQQPPHCTTTTAATPMHYPFTDFYTNTLMTEDLEDSIGEQLHGCQRVGGANTTTAASVGCSVVPSTRPFPSSASRCIVVHSTPQQPPSLSPARLAPDEEGQSASAINGGAAAVVSHSVPPLTVPAGCGEEGGPAVSQNNSSVPPSHRSRGLPGRNAEQQQQHDNNHNDGHVEECLPTLSIFHSLPPLFTDLMAHTNRRPPRPGKKNDGDDPARMDEARYVYLVGHRCRRTVCAAGIRHDIGAMVVLEGDMGIEMGSVEAVLPVEEFERLEKAELARRGFPTEHDVVTAAFILRPATEEEKIHYNQTLCSLARDLLTFLQHQLNPANFVDCHVENMIFLDCEFQADCRKIYIYYRAKKRVLFRELAQYLHSFYQCRIWLHEVAKGASTVSGDSSQDAEVS